MQQPVIITGGTIRPMAPDARTTVEAIVVNGDRVAFAGTLDDARRIAGARAETRDLGGLTVLPGFVDAHTHPLMLGQCSSWADLSGVTDPAVVVARLRAHAATVPVGRPIRGFGYDQHILPGGRHPHADLLDQVSADVPVVIMHASGHGYVANHVALQQAGISSDTPTPPGGLIGHDDDGHLDGRVFDSACDLLTGPEGVKITNHGPNLHLPDTAAGLRANLVDAEQQLLAAGITSIGDAQVTDRELHNYLDARAHGQWRIRTSMYLLSSHLHLLEGLGITAGLGSDGLRIAGVKCYADGSLISGTAYLPCGCGGGHDFDGYLYHDFDELASLIERSHRLGLQTMTHVQGTTPIGVVLDTIADAQRRWPTRHSLRHRIDHGAFPSDEHIAQMRELDVWPVPQPSQVWQYGAGIRRKLGEFAERMYPTGLYWRAGVPVVLSSDTPVTQPDVFRALWAAVTRNTLGGPPLGPECAVPLDVALAGYTTGGAGAMHLEHSVGSLAPGRFADMAIVTADPLVTVTDDLPSIRVVETIIGGTTVWSA